MKVLHCQPLCLALLEVKCHMERLLKAGHDVAAHVLFHLNFSAHYARNNHEQEEPHSAKTKPHRQAFLKIMLQSMKSKQLLNIIWSKKKKIKLKKN